MRALARAENVTVTPEKLEERVGETLRRERSAKDVAQRIDPEAVRSYTENVLRNEKVMELIEGVVTGNETLNPKS